MHLISGVSVLIFTGRNEVLAKVIFLHLSVIHSVHRGGEYLTRRPPDQVPNPPGPCTPPGPGTHPPGTRYTPLGPGTPPRTRFPRRATTSGIRSMISWYASYWNAFLVSIRLTFSSVSVECYTKVKIVI